MSKVRTTNDLVLSSIEFHKTTNPELDLKPGQVARDLFIDGPSIEISKLYEELSKVKTAQSLFSSTGSELDAVASNFGETRKQGSKSSGSALLTFNDIPADIAIPKGGTVLANTGASFTVTASTTVSASNKSLYKSIASKYKSSLDFVGITDQYAIEVIVTATATGVSGNISKYSLKSTTIQGVSNITNTSAFAGGSSAESDSAFKRRLFGIFSGANTGTETGYKNTALKDPNIVDCIVVGPGDDLMTRDGTVVFVAENGTRTITSEGTGGKVDIYTYGFRLSEILDSYIYFDKSNKDDPTDIANDFVLGQIEGDENKTVSRKRIDNIKNKNLPNQPVTNILEISGSSSGSNFLPKTVDELGRISGNYELVYDDGAYAGSPWGFDRIRWIDNQIRDLSEDITKGKFNSQDSTSFSDVTKIGKVQQSIQIINENSRVNQTDRTSIQLSHSPISSVSRVFNQTTGERYIVTNQNPDGGNTNTTGRITISGSTLPSISDILQVDYIWTLDYDPSWDFDNKTNSDNIRSVSDSIDWGYSNTIRREQSTVLGTSTLNVTVSNPVNAVVSVNTFQEETSIVTLSNDRLAVLVDLAVTNVISIFNTNNVEYFKTAENDGNFTGYTIYLPTDTIAQVGDMVTIRYNAVDQFTSNGISGSFNDTVITLPSSTNIASGTIVEVNYLADTRQLIPATAISNLPIVRNLNYFQTALNNSFGSQPTTHIFSTGTTISKNLKKAPSKLKLTLAGTVSPGVFTVAGTTIQRIADGVFTTSSNGFTHDLSSLVKKALGLNSNQTIPSNVSIVKLVSFEKVQVNSNKDVLSVEKEYDVFDYTLKNNEFVKSEATINSNLSATQITIPNTTNNNDQIPIIGDSFRVIFYIGTTNDSENISFSKSGSLYTQKTFLLIDSVSVSSGFTSAASQSATLTVTPQNQPVQSSRYTVYYDYLAPKPNERISIRYNKNQVITDCTLEVENTRPIGSDVLVKNTYPILVDITLYIVVSTEYKNDNSSAIVKQNVIDAVMAAMNQSLGKTIDQSDFIGVAQGISGVDRVRCTHFNIANEAGMVLSITAQKNQYIQANDIVVNIEQR
jgi:hypothetical protein